MISPQAVKVQCGPVSYFSVTTNPAKFKTQMESNLRNGRCSNHRLQSAFNVHGQVTVSVLDAGKVPVVEFVRGLIAESDTANSRQVVSPSYQVHKPQKAWTICNSQPFLDRFNILHQMSRVGPTPEQASIWKSPPEESPSADADSIFYRWRRIWNHLSHEDIVTFFTKSSNALLGMAPTPKADMVVNGLLSFPEDEICPISDLGTLSLAVTTVLGESDKFQTDLHAWCRRNRTDVYHALDRVVLS